MSDLQAAPTAAANPPAQARAARLEKFQREQAIVEYLNRGVSVAEISASVGVGEKRMRAIIREILARRMPGPPMEFGAVQMSRLNEALLVAYSAMSPTNLGAVDRVIKIVRELDRYRGFCAAERRRPEASSGRESRAFDARRKTAPTVARGPPSRRRGAPPTALGARSPSPIPLSLHGGGAAPLLSLPCAARGGGGPCGAWWRGALAEGHPRWRYSRPSGPGNPAQRLENTQSAPGFAPAPAARPESASDALPATEAAPRGFFANLAKDAFSSGTAAAHARLRDVLIAAREGAAWGGSLRRAASAREIRRKALITLNSRPGILAGPPGRRPARVRSQAIPPTAGLSLPRACEGGAGERRQELQCAGFPSSCAAFSALRSRNRWILPLGVFGNSLTKAISRG